MHWLYENLVSRDNAVRFYGNFSPNFDQLNLDLGKARIQEDPKKVPPIELIVPPLQSGDLYDNTSIPPNFGLLISPKLKSVFDMAGINNVQWYKTQIMSSSGNLVSDRYALGNIVGSLGIVDFERSDLELGEDDGNIDFIDKLVFRDDVEPLSLHIFRLREYIPLKVVSDRLKELVEESGCTGVRIIEPERLKL